MSRSWILMTQPTPFSVGLLLSEAWLGAFFRHGHSVNRLSKGKFYADPDDFAFTIFPLIPQHRIMLQSHLERLANISYYFIYNVANISPRYFDVIKPCHDGEFIPIQSLYVLRYRLTHETRRLSVHTSFSVRRSCLSPHYQQHRDTCRPTATSTLM